MDKNTFLSLPNSDLTLYYSGTFLRIRTDSKADWEWSRIETTNAIAGQYFNFLDVGTNQKYKINETEIDFKLPVSRIYNFKDRIVYLTKTGNRTQRKGLNSETVEILSPLLANLIPPKIWKQNKFMPNGENYTLLLEKISPLSFEKTLLCILKGNALGRNLDGRFWLSCGLFSKRPTIWMRDRPVGELDTKKNKILPLIDLYEGELLSLFESHGFSL